MSILRACTGFSIAIGIGIGCGGSTTNNGVGTRTAGLRAALPAVSPRAVHQAARRAAPPSGSSRSGVSSGTSSGALEGGASSGARTGVLERHVGRRRLGRRSVERGLERRGRWRPAAPDAGSCMSTAMCAVPTPIATPRRSRRPMSRQCELQRGRRRHAYVQHRDPQMRRLHERYAMRHQRPVLLAGRSMRAVPASGNCQTGFACDTMTYRCVRACTSDMQCPSGAASHCNTSTMRCVQCLTNMNCMGAAPVCDTTTNACVQCLTNANCTNRCARIAT